MNVSSWISVPCRPQTRNRPANLTQTEAAYYPASREWALALYKQNPSAQGFIWASRRDDDEKAIVLFGDQTDMLEVEPIPSLCYRRTEALELEVLTLAVRLDVLLVTLKYK